MALADSNVRKLPAEPTPLYRTAPHNIEAEQALLGAILINNQAFDRVSDFLKPEHFSENIHREIYDLISRFVRMGKTADPLTLKPHLPETQIGNQNISQYLATLAAAATSVINAADYGRTIYDLSTRRALIQIGEEIVNDAYGAPVDFAPKKQIEDAERKLYEIAESGRYEGGFLDFKDALRTAVDMAASAYERDGGLSGIATGLSRLDQQLGGLQKSDLIVLAGRPGMGKTALATNIAYHVAAAWEGEFLSDGRRVTKSGGIVGFFSLEMSGEQLATRIISEQTEIASNEIRRGQISPAQFDVIAAAAAEMEMLPLFIDDTGGLSIAQLAARARRLKRQRGLDLIVVDYIQLLQGSSRRSSENRVQEITEITTNLKALAKELNIPIIALSQLSRQVENRDDKRPQLSDLRESGSIEQDADVVMFVYREEYYLANREPKQFDEKNNLRDEYREWEKNLKEAKNKAEVIVGKQRHGPTGPVKLHFEGRFTRFSNLAEDNQIPSRLE